jgi:hypothetical protein
MGDLASGVRSQSKEKERKQHSPAATTKTAVILVPRIFFFFFFFFFFFVFFVNDSLITLMESEDGATTAAVSIVVLTSAAASAPGMEVEGKAVEVVVGSGGDDRTPIFPNRSCRRSMRRIKTSHIVSLPSSIDDIPSSLSSSSSSANMSRLLPTDEGAAGAENDDAPMTVLTTA